MLRNTFILFGYITSCYGSHFTKISQKHCSGDVIETVMPTVAGSISAEECMDDCDSYYSCVVSVFTTETGACNLQSTCQVPYTDDEAVDIYFKNEISGWSLYRNKDCLGNDLLRNSTIGSPSQCVHLCMQHVTCGAVLYMMSISTCFLKSWCDHITDYDGLDLYRPLDRTLGGYTEYTDTILVGNSQSGVSTVQSNDVTDYDVYHDSLCAAICRRQGCGSFYRKGTNCHVFSETFDTTPESDVTSYIPKAFSTEGFTEYQNVHCTAPDIITEFPGVPTAEECVYMCTLYPGCAHALYEWDVKVCYIKGQCESYATNDSYILFERNNRAVRQCKWTTIGQEYNGTIATTITGATCQRWDSTYANVASYHAEENYCRNPNLTWRGPWCYVASESENNISQMQYCDIPMCLNASQCRTSSDGVDYNGMMTILASGHTCERWDTQGYNTIYPHQLGGFPSSNTEAENYCRNPHGQPRPWCYSNQVQYNWGFCDIPICQMRHGGYTMYSNHACWDMDIKTYLNIGDATECQHLCDSYQSNQFCTAIVYEELVNGCYLKTNCDTRDNTAENNDNYDIYIRNDIPGWTLSLAMDCPGNDITCMSMYTPSDCVEQCIENINCTAVAYGPKTTICCIKYTCEKLVMLDGFNVYRMLDKEMQGFRSVNLDLECGSALYSTTVFSPWQCAAYSRRISGSVFYVEEDGLQYKCEVYSTCDSSDYILSDDTFTFYKVIDFSSEGFTKVNLTWCEGENIVSEYTGISTGEECASICRTRSQCVNAVYDFYTYMCYLKSNCSAIQTSKNHNFYTKEVAVWSEWSLVTTCDPNKWIQTRTRACPLGLNCGDEESTYVIKCFPDIRLGEVFTLKNWRLLNHTIHTYRDPLLISCISTCSFTSDCHSVNYRYILKEEDRVCELNNAYNSNSSIVSQEGYTFHHLNKPY